jgi:hypothetical protein
MWWFHHLGFCLDKTQRTIVIKTTFVKKIQWSKTKTIFNLTHIFDLDYGTLWHIIMWSRKWHNLLPQTWMYHHNPLMVFESAGMKKGKNKIKFKKYICMWKSFYPERVLIFQNKKNWGFWETMLFHKFRPETPPHRPMHLKPLDFFTHTAWNHTPPPPKKKTF